MDKTLKEFFTHEDYQSRMDKYADLRGANNSWLLFVACDAGTELAESVKREYESLLRLKYKQKRKKKRVIPVPLFKNITNKFERDGKDGTCPRLPHNVSGADAFVFQNCMDLRENSLSVNDNLVQLGQMICTLRDYKAERITAIVPYYPYSRQDKPSFMQREYAHAKFVADIFTVAGVNDVLSYHPHATSIKALFPTGKQFSFVSGNDLFIDVFSQFRGREDVVAVSTDSGGSKETRFIANSLDISYCPGLKERPEQKKTHSLGVQGNLNGKKVAILTDDETATFSSFLNQIDFLHHAGIREFYGGVSHMRVAAEWKGTRYIDKVIEAHERYNLKMLHITDSVPPSEEFLMLPFIQYHSLANMWARVINRMHYDQSVRKIFASYDPRQKRR